MGRDRVHTLLYFCIHCLLIRRYYRKENNLGLREGLIKVEPGLVSIEEEEKE